jgi:hypothetical protein
MGGISGLYPAPNQALDLAIRLRDRVKAAGRRLVGHWHGGAEIFQCDRAGIPGHFDGKPQQFGAGCYCHLLNPLVDSEITRAS